MQRLLPLLVALSITGCRKADATVLTGLTIQDATLREVSLESIGFLVGGIGGSAILEVETDQGRVREYPVRLRGTQAGLAFDFSFTGAIDGPIHLRFGGTREGDQLLGRYKGTGMDFVLGAGVDTRQLRNKHDIRMEGALFSVGAAFWVGYETMLIELDDGTDPTE